MVSIHTPVIEGFYSLLSSDLRIKKIELEMKKLILESDQVVDRDTANKIIETIQFYHRRDVFRHSYLFNFYSSLIGNGLMPAIQTGQYRLSTKFK